MTQHHPRPKGSDKAPKILDVRIYPSDTEGFDIIVRLHGFAFQRLSTWPTLQEAFDEAGKIERRKPNAPVYVFRLPFSEILSEAMSEALTPIVMALESKESSNG